MSISDRSQCSAGKDVFTADTSATIPRELPEDKCRFKAALTPARSGRTVLEPNDVKAPGDRGEVALEGFGSPCAGRIMA